MAPPLHERLYRLARRLSPGRMLRYLDLWLRYLWRRSQAAFRARPDRAQTLSAARQEVALAGLDPGSASRAAVGSWSTLDLANARLHGAFLTDIAAARPELGITPGVIDHVLALKRAPDLSLCVDALVARGAEHREINTAIYLLLLRRLPAEQELPMIGTRHPRHALIATLSGDQYLKIGRRTVGA